MRMQERIQCEGGMALGGSGSGREKAEEEEEEEEKEKEEKSARKAGLPYRTHRIYPGYRTYPGYCASRLSGIFPRLS